MIKPLFKNVLVLINGSASSIDAAKYGILMSKLYHCNLKALYVVDTSTLKQLTLNKYFVKQESEEYEKGLMANGERYLQYVKDLGTAKGIKIETELKKGSVWSETVKAAENSESNLILLGGVESTTHDNRDLLSTTYREIMINASCSVLIVRQDMIEQLYKLA